MYAEEGGLDTINPREYCLYKTPNGCQRCAVSYVKEGTCVVPEKIIKNCLQYASETKCSVCAYNHHLNEESTECPKNTLENCFVQ